MFVKVFMYVYEHSLHNHLLKYIIARHIVHFVSITFTSHLRKDYIPFLMKIFFKKLKLQEVINRTKYYLFCKTSSSFLSEKDNNMCSIANNKENGNKYNLTMKI